MHKNRKRRQKLYEKIAMFCEVTQESIAKIPVFVLRGKHELEVEGCDGILEYTSSRIVLSVGKEKFTVVGDMLVLSDFNDNLLYIRGNIVSASFGIIKEGDDTVCSENF